MTKHLLSICIPTNGVARWVVPTVENIYAIETDLSLFEVVVADNGNNSDLADPIKVFEKYPNFRYVKTKADGFYNIIENFIQARGDYMIKINHRCILHKGAIEHIYKTAEKYYEKKPLLYFSNHLLKEGSLLEFDNFDAWLYKLSYFSSLSQGLFFWKEDIERVPYIKFAKMSPNVSLMFDSKTKHNFILDDTPIEHQQDSKGKYGYDLFDTFSVLYLDLVNEVRAEGYVSKRTFIKIKKDILQFLTNCYVAMKVYHDFENYSLDGMKESMGVYYSDYDYYKIIAMGKLAIGSRIKLIAKKVLKTIVSTK